jgi:hypothetical protein
MFQIRKSASTLAEVGHHARRDQPVEPVACHDIGQRVSVRVVLVAQAIAAPARSVLAKPPTLAEASTPRGVAVPSPEAGQACASSLQIHP